MRVPLRPSACAALAAVLVASAACTSTAKPAGRSSPQPGVPSSPSPSPKRPPHVFVIVMENHSYPALIGNPQAPYLNQLARRYGLATNYRAVSHPSLPNYLAMTAGSTFGVNTDCTSCSFGGAHLGDQLEARGFSWKAYLEGMPSPCYPGPSYGRYAKKHDPFLYFDDVIGNAQRCTRHVVPLTAFVADAARDALPDVSFITPDICHDMHDCSVATGDAWLHAFVPQIMRTAAYSSGGIIAITVDEEDTSTLNHVPAIVIAPSMEAGTTSKTLLTHYSLLRAIEDAYGLPPIAHAADPGTVSLFGAFGLP